MILKEQNIDYLTDIVWSSSCILYVKEDNPKTEHARLNKIINE